MNLNLNEIAATLRNYEGITRKRAVEPFIRAFQAGGEHEFEIIASFGEDAAVIGYNDDEVLLIASDGIWHKLMQVDPQWAGYCAVLVNLHDIAAMGGKPIAMVDVFSISSRQTCTKVSQGMAEASRKFGVPVIGGHTHPDMLYDVIDVAILGTAKRDSVIYSSTARPGDNLLVAYDRDGRVHPSSDVNWDSTSHKAPSIVRKQMESMRELGEKHLVTAGKDISNPGIIGTIGMMLEVSNAGARVDLNGIPVPDGVELLKWLKMYPGMGFIVTCRPGDTDDVIRTFRENYLTSAKIGEIVGGSKLVIADKEQEEVLFDFSKDNITGIRIPARKSSTK